MVNASVCLVLGLFPTIQSALAQNPPPQTVLTVPTFSGSFVTNGKQYSYTVAGKNPDSGGNDDDPDGGCSAFPFI